MKRADGIHGRQELGTARGTISVATEFAGDTARVPTLRSDSHRCVSRRIGGVVEQRLRKVAQAARRGVRQLNQDDDWPDYLLHHRARHRFSRKLEAPGAFGVKVLIYFEVVSTLALVIGLLVVNLSQPGVGFSTPEQMEQFLETAGPKAAETTATATQLSVTDFLLHLIPKTIVSPFVTGDLLQILIVSLLAAVAILGLGERRQVVLQWIDTASLVFFGILKILVRLAPIGAFGAMAFTVAEFRGEGLLKLLRFMLLFYATAFVFIAGVLGGIARWCGFSLWRFIVYIKEEILLVLGTSSSETALPGLMQKLERAGCSRSTVGLVVPTGYSFNLDGTNIYMSMAALFVAQATVLNCRGGSNYGCSSWRC